ncbi:N-acetylglucosamine-6-phosphate deacetylase [Halalkalibacter kiskunsagensis]|uniref:N-acetylglucosamine-6-phosphate deacetylase n=1 Tax=Halalkalibacter kiskunsagensis TaxID=1548599 RepID=A0ABV6K966_9BACI
MKDETLLIKNVRLYQEAGVVEKGYLLLQCSKIIKMGVESELESITHAGETIDGEELNAIPGFIDGHIHGANGADMMDATPEALEKLAQILPAEGTTSFLATTITQSQENIDKALENIARYKNKPKTSEILGVHLEGPFIEKTKAGAQPVEYVIPPSIELFKKWQKLSGNKIKTITFAPEKDEDRTFLTYLAAQGINVSAGHTGAGIDIMKEVVKLGVNQLTHLCNAMSGLHHRDVGVVGAAFLLEELQSELIVDGIHVSPEMVKILYKSIGPSRLSLITDSVRAKGLAPGDYDLGGQIVTVDEQQATLQDGTLAGSMLKMIDAVKNMREFTGASVQELIEMASSNPAKQLQLYDRKGSLAVGKDADLLLVDDDLSIHYTICQGKVAYKGEGK